MTLTRTALFACVFLTLAPATAAVAQDVAAAGDAPAEAGLSVLDRWDADHTTIFDASEVTLADLEYVARPVIIFADSPNDPRVADQLQLLERDRDAFAARDVIVIVDTDRQSGSDARRQLRPRGFNIVLLDKDGRIGQRRNQLTAGADIWRFIDRMPIRQEELRNR